MSVKVTIKKTGTVVVDTNAVADVAVLALVGAIVQRQEDGLDANDARFKPYSDGYKAELLREGENTNVDHHRTGLLWTQIKELRRRIVATGTVGLGMAPAVTATVITPCAWHATSFRTSCCSISRCPAGAESLLPRRSRSPVPPPR